MKSPKEMNLYELDIEIMQRTLSLQMTHIAQFHLAKLRSSLQDAVKYCNQANAQSALLQSDITRFEGLPSKMMDVDGYKADYIEKFREIKKKFAQQTQYVDGCIADNSSAPQPSAAIENAPPPGSSDGAFR